MYNFENNRDKRFGIEYSRYINSWVNAGGNFNTYDIGTIKERMKDLGKYIPGYHDFIKWLTDLGVEDIDITNIAVMAGNGKLGLEESAKARIKELLT